MSGYEVKQSHKRVIELQREAMDRQDKKFRNTLQAYDALPNHRRLNSPINRIASNLQGI